MAYEIIKRLEKSKEETVFERLYSAVKKTEKKKGQIHKVFEDSLMLRSVIPRNLSFKSFSICT
jgi:hypothetical protein